MASENREGATDFAVDLGPCHARKRAELLGIQERLVNPPRAGFEVLFLMDRPGHDDCFHFCGLSRCFPSVGLGVGYPQTTKPDGSPGDHLPSRVGIRRKRSKIRLINHPRPR